MELRSERELPFPAERVWSLFSDFGNMDWMSIGLDRIETEGEGVGMTRTLYWHFSDCPRVHRLEALDPDTMTLSYSPLDPVVPVEDLYITNWVEPLTATSCRMHSEMRFTCATPDTEQEVATVLRQLAEQSADDIMSYLAQHPQSD